tara:strand:- start:41 stop:754 length:714 start_codon:yes stop_codon:yes gene_type:complete
MKVIVPFGYYVGYDVIHPHEHDFTDLRNEEKISLNTIQRGLHPQSQQAHDWDNLPPHEYSKKYTRILAEAKYHSLRDLIEAKFNMMMYRLLGSDYKFKITTSWVTRLGRGEKIQEHRHHNCYYSGILYHGEDYTNAAVLTLENPIATQSRVHFSEQDQSQNLMNSDYGLTPHTGALYFWPSEFKHSTGFNESEARYSLAFNFVPTQAIYNGDSSFNLDWLSPAESHNLINDTNNYPT